MRKRNVLLGGRTFECFHSCMTIFKGGLLKKFCAGKKEGPFPKILLNVL